MSEEFDSGPIYSIMRKRHHDLRVRVEKLMFRESRLEADVTANTAAHAKLEATIRQVLQVPADATELQRMAEDTGSRLARDRTELSSIKVELSLVREAMKYADIAHEALHWGGFADQVLKKFDLEKSAAPVRTAA
ncbi:hypothetical protein G6L37_00120 [Agrobacterium rubi]|nr:hypothetical protein [Agrobacterium rubi]NTF23655.1 hypothetical protein [Agrobacterium rubi]